MEALQERYTIQELGRKYEIHPSQISAWKAQFLENAKTVFEQPVKDAKTQAQEKEEHYLKVIGQQKIEIDFLKKALS